jgi:hypothetical protein
MMDLICFLAVEQPGRDSPVIVARTSLPRAISAVAAAAVEEAEQRVRHEDNELVAGLHRDELDRVRHSVARLVPEALR